MQADIVSVLVRALSFVCLFQAAGGALFIATFGRGISYTRTSIARSTLLAALAAIVFVSAHVFLEPARMAGNLGGVLDASLQSFTLHSSSGAMAVVRIIGLGLIAFGALGESDGRTTVMVVGAALAIGSFALVGHTAASPERWLLSGVLLCHLLIVAYWFGALPPLFAIARQEAPATAASIIDAFSRVATWLVPGLFIAGVVLSAVLIPRWETFGQPYGRLLIAKVAGFALLMGLASLNKWRFVPAIARAEPGAVRAFRGSVATEYVLITGVLLGTAVLTSFFSPEH